MSVRAWFEVLLVAVALVGWRRELDGLWNSIAPRLGAYVETWFKKRPP